MPGRDILKKEFDYLLVRTLNTYASVEKTMMYNRQMGISDSALLDIHLENHSVARENLYKLVDQMITMIDKMDRVLPD